MLSFDRETRFGKAAKFFSVAFCVSGYKVLRLLRETGSQLGSLFACAYRLDYLRLGAFGLCPIRLGMEVGTVLRSG